MRRLPLSIHLFALAACLVTHAAPAEADTMPGLRRAIEAIAEARAFTLPSMGRVGA